MKQSLFVKTNQQRWLEFEQLIVQKNPDPDVLADLFIQITDDLSYASTQYPNTDTTRYLNHLASKIHLAIYKNKQESKSRFITFWTEEVPNQYYKHRKHVLISFLVFFISCLIGALSAANDDTFIRLVLGDQYVDMTLNNIENGQPMNVYASAGQETMFFGITINNIRVSFIAFLWGGIIGGVPLFLFFSFGTAFLLFQNGIMLGSFQYFFYQKGLLLDSALTIWIHGTIEISAIVLAGAAGIVAGNSFLFPGTYKRMDSLKKGFKDGLKMIIGLVPFFIIAGFLESFVTRLFGMPTFLKIGIIGASLFLIIWYFIWYPYKLNNTHAKQLRKS